MRISFSQQRVIGFPSNEVVQLLGFKNGINFILCSIDHGTNFSSFRYSMWCVTGKDSNVQKHVELESSLRHGIKDCTSFSAPKIWPRMPCPLDPP